MFQNINIILVDVSPGWCAKYYVFHEHTI